MLTRNEDLSIDRKAAGIKKQCNVAALFSSRHVTAAKVAGVEQQREVAETIPQQKERIIIDDFEFDRAAPL
ncbi:MAG: hypothetical protein EOO88_28280, partial [Pedobacter sp.]